MSDAEDDHIPPGEADESIFSHGRQTEVFNHLSQQLSLQHRQPATVVRLTELNIGEVAYQMVLAARVTNAVAHLAHLHSDKGKGRGKQFVPNPPTPLDLEYLMQDWPAESLQIGHVRYLPAKFRQCLEANVDPQPGPWQTQWQEAWRELTSWGIPDWLGETPYSLRRWPMDTRSQTLQKRNTQLCVLFKNVVNQAYPTETRYLLSAMMQPVMLNLGLKITVLPVQIDQLGDRKAIKFGTGLKVQMTGADPAMRFPGRPREAMLARIRDILNVQQHHIGADSRLTAGQAMHRLLDDEKASSSTSTPRQRRRQ